MTRSLKLDLVRKKKNDNTGNLKRATKGKEEIRGEKTHSQAEPGIRSGDQEMDYNKKNPPDCDSNVGGKERNGQTKGWGSENTFIGLTLSEEGNTSFFKKYTWNVRQF